MECHVNWWCFFRCRGSSAAFRLYQNNDNYYRHHGYYPANHGARDDSTGAVQNNQTSQLRILVTAPKCTCIFKKFKAKEIGFSARELHTWNFHWCCNHSTCSSSSGSNSRFCRTGSTWIRPSGTRRHCPLKKTLIHIIGVGSKMKREAKPSAEKFVGLSQNHQCLYYIYLCKNVISPAPQFQLQCIYMYTQNARVAYAC